MVIGLAGKYCSGKNAAAEIFRDMGIPSIDVDKLGHEALDARTDKIRAVFGEEVMSGDDGARKVDRRALGRLVFADPQKLRALEEISHPWMKEETARLVKKHLDGGADYVVINAAILYRMQLDRLCDCIIWVEAPLFQRIRRAASRDNAGIVQILKRIYTQRQLKPKSSGNSVDIYRVGNNSNADALKRKIESVLEQIVQKGNDGR